MSQTRLRLLDQLNEMACAGDWREVAEAAVGAFHEVARGDYYSVCCFTADFQNLEIFHPGEGWLERSAPLRRSFEVLRAIEPAGPSHPVMIAFGKTREPGGFIRSQLMSDRHWQRTAHYQTVDRGLGIRDMASVFLYSDGGRLMTVNCGRTRAFDEEELRPVQHIERVMSLLLRGREQDARRERLRDADHTADCLTARENEIMHWVREGKRNGEIAIILALSPHTVRKHLEHVFDKLGVETRTAAVIAMEA